MRTSAKFGYACRGTQAPPLGFTKSRVGLLCHSLQKFFFFSLRPANLAWRWIRRSSSLPPLANSSRDPPSLLIPLSANIVLTLECASSNSFTMSTPLHITCYYDLKAWTKKHRRSLLVAAGLVGGGTAVYYGIRYFGLTSQARKEREAARAALLQREAEDRAEAQLQSHFESIQRISDTTTLPSVLPQLKASLFSKVDLSGLTERLILGKDDPQLLSQRDKVQLWQELKTLSFARTVCAMSALCLLDIFIRIQLNILGRHVYFDTARDVMNSEDPHVPLSMSVQHKFIAFAGYLHQKGAATLVADIYRAVEFVLKGKQLKEPYTLDDLRDVFMRIRATLESKRSPWVQYVLPPDNVLPDDLIAGPSSVGDASSPVADMASHDSEVLDQLMKETRAVLASNEFHDVFAVCLDALLDGVMEELYTLYRGSSDSGIPLAKLLPPVAGAGSTLLEHPDENRFIRILASLPQVHAFCALVYTNSSEELASRVDSFKDAYDTFSDSS